MPKAGSSVPVTPFDGFPRECESFLAALAGNNSREWFHAHKADHDAYVVEPAKRFIVALGERVRAFAPGVVADPRVNGSLFRQSRDTRFAHGGPPYKTHLGMWLWEGELGRMECSGFYVHVEPPTLMVAAGMHVFPRPHLEAYRASLCHPRHGPALLDAVEAVRAAGPYNVGGEHYRRVPPGYDCPPELHDLLRHNGLYAGIEQPAADALTSPRFVDWCAARLREVAPIHRWLVELTRRVR